MKGIWDFSVLSLQFPMNLKLFQDEKLKIFFFRDLWSLVQSFATHGTAFDQLKSICAFQNNVTIEIDKRTVCSDNFSWIYN